MSQDMTTSESNMVTIHIDGEAFKVKAGQNLLEACLGIEQDVPYFCWHPSLGSVGSCRQCAVQVYQDENDERGRMIMSCMTPVSDGMIVSLKAEYTKRFREQNIEVMMANHPHDYPIYKEGGECHLQDMTIRQSASLGKLLLSSFGRDP